MKLYLLITDLGQDGPRIMRELLDMAGEDAGEVVRTVGNGVRVPLAWAVAVDLVNLSDAEVHLPDVEQAPPISTPSTEPDQFDPGAHNVEEVLRYLNATTDFDEHVRVLSAELTGKNRATIAQWKPKTGQDTT